MVEVLTQAREQVLSLLDRPMFAFSDHDLVAIFDNAGALARAAQALQTAALAAIDAHGLPIAQGATSTTVWVRERERVSVRSAASQVGLAQALGDLPRLTAAYHAGQVNSEQAKVFARAVGEVSAQAGRETRDKAEAQMVAFAAQFGPETLTTLGGQILRLVDPDAADRRDADALARAEKRAAQTRAFTMTPDSLGRVRLQGWLGSEAAAYVTAAIEPLCKPAGAQDDRTPTQRRADALVDVCRLALATDDLPAKGGEAARVVFTMNFDDFAARAGVGMLDNGETITAETMRFVACNAGLIPAVLNTQGVPINLGRERRFFTGAVRRALILRDGGCAFPGCDRPPKWCEGHHRTLWSCGGKTDLDEGVLMCGHHHRVVHKDGWEIQLGTDGLPEFIPPAWLDPLQLPRRNHYHRRP